mmetsp:Transcript_40312/g.60305  ORF Transcript_40312/g.60305 Transcript_40312/m.60305 type:complete len:97 (+) Transcript_40312:557-847(+)
MPSCTRVGEPLGRRSAQRDMDLKGELEVESREKHDAGWHMSRLAWTVGAVVWACRFRGRWPAHKGLPAEEMSAQSFQCVRGSFFFRGLKLAPSKVG